MASAVQSSCILPSVCVHICVALLTQQSYSEHHLDYMKHISIYVSLNISGSLVPHEDLKRIESPAENATYFATVREYSPFMITTMKESFTPSLSF